MCRTIVVCVACETNRIHNQFAVDITELIYVIDSPHTVRVGVDVGVGVWACGWRGGGVQGITQFFLASPVSTWTMINRYSCPGLPNEIRNGGEAT